MMDIKCLFVWTPGSVMQVFQLISTLKNYLFRNFQSLASWPIGSWVIKGFLQLLWSLGSLAFYLFLAQSVLPILPEIQSQWDCAQTQVTKIRNLRNQTCRRLVWMAAPISHSMAWSVGSPKFICLCINFSRYLNQRISDTFCQTNSP